MEAQENEVTRLNGKKSEKNNYHRVGSSQFLTARDRLQTYQGPLLRLEAALAELLAHALKASADGIILKRDG
jgi:hypothetical protein